MPISVVLVDDSAVVRRMLAHIISADPDVEVVGSASNGKKAVDAVESLKPDVVVLDVEMPVMDGIEALTIIKHRQPETVVIMFSTLTNRGASATLDALTHGADDYITKPSNTGSLEAAAREINESLLPRIKALGAPDRPRPVRRPAATPGPRSVRKASPDGIRLSTPRRTGLLRPEVIVLAISTGGPDALNTLVPSLPGNLPVPLLITQHMPPIFTKLLAERLDKASALTVREGVEGALIGPGEVWLAPGGTHMVVTRDGDGRPCLHLDDGPPVKSCKPAADPMFTSAVDVFGEHVLGVVMTGMGNDGHHGAERVRDAGGAIICQDQDTSVVWGMPGVVARAGLAEQLRPLTEIGKAIVEATTLSAPLTSGHRP